MYSLWFTDFFQPTVPGWHFSSCWPGRILISKKAFRAWSGFSPEVRKSECTFNSWLIKNDSYNNVRSVHHVCAEVRVGSNWLCYICLDWRKVPPISGSRTSFQVYITCLFVTVHQRYSFWVSCLLSAWSKTQWFNQKLNKSWSRVFLTI